jgi:hypothetical protein
LKFSQRSFLTSEAQSEDGYPVRWSIAIIQIDVSVRRDNQVSNQNGADISSTRVHLREKVLNGQRTGEIRVMPDIAGDQYGVCRLRDFRETGVIGGRAGNGQRFAAEGHPVIRDGVEDVPNSGRIEAESRSGEDLTVFRKDASIVAGDELPGYRALSTTLAGMPKGDSSADTRTFYPERSAALRHPHYRPRRSARAAGEGKRLRFVRRFSLHFRAR